MYISKIRVRNYKSIKDSGEVKIDNKIMAFIGQNNAGKSAILDAIQCVFPSSKKVVTKSDFHKGTHDNIEITLWLSDVSDAYLEEQLFEDVISKLSEKIRNLEDENAEQDKIDSAKNKLEETRNKKLTESKQTYRINDEEICVKLVVTNTDKMSTKYYLDAASVTEVKETELKKILPSMKVIPAIRDPKNESTAGANSYLKELISMLDDDMSTDVSLSGGRTVSYKELNKIIADESAKRCNSISNSITGYYNAAIGVNDYKVVVSSDVNISKGTTYYTKIIDSSTGIENDILNCGTGYQSMIILSILEAYVELAQKKTEYILVIEEPEVYLHPSLQRKMIDTLVKISSDNQVIFSSHSPITVGKLTREQIKLITRTNGEAAVNDITISCVIDELGIRADDILVNKGIIFVEGQDDRAVVNCILEKVHKGASDDINVLVTGSCENLKFYANAELLINNRLEIPYLIIRDSDGMLVDERKKELLQEITNVGRNLTGEQIHAISDRIFIVSKYSMEGYFVNAAYLIKSGIDEELLIDMIRCYECQYCYYSNLESTEANRKQVASWYQPKHLLENFEDKFKAEDTKARQRYKQLYEERWAGFEKCSSCENSISRFFEGRDIINVYTHSKKLAKDEYMVELIESNSLEELCSNGFNDLVEVLETLCNQIYK